MRHLDATATIGLILQYFISRLITKSNAICVYELRRAIRKCVTTQKYVLESYITNAVFEYCIALEMR